MKKLNTFFRIFWKSISSLAYYRDVVKAPFSFSLKYFAAFSIIMGLLLTVVTSLVILPPVTKFATRLATRAQILFPPDLVITVKNGELSTNVAEPLRFPIPFELFTDQTPAISDQKQIYLMTIDTEARAADFPKMQSIILVTKTSLVISDERDDYRIFSLKDFDDTTLDKPAVDQFITTLLPLLRLLPALLVTFLLGVFLVLLPLTRLLSLLLLSLLLAIAAKLMNISMTYSKLYQIGLHALTLPILIQIILTSVGLTPQIPFFNSILYLLLTLAILAELKKSSPQILSSNPPDKSR